VRLMERRGWVGFWHPSGMQLLFGAFPVVSLRSTTG
jgi:hypothetical protein